jgi:uncharacterized membrane-anchored protein
MAFTYDPPLSERASSPESHERIVKMLNKVPEVTLYFWVIKILATTVGETAADFLNTNIGVGLTGTTLIMAGFLAVALFFQFRLHQYVPAVYWLSVVHSLISAYLIPPADTDPCAHQPRRRSLD